MAIVWIVVSVGLICCCVSFVSTLIYRVRSNHIDDINIDVIGPRIDDPEARRKLEEEKRKKLLA
jgi:hypothetical protein